MRVFRQKLTAKALGSAAWQERRLWSHLWGGRLGYWARAPAAAPRHEHLDSDHPVFLEHPWVELPVRDSSGAARGAVEAAAAPRGWAA